MNAIFTVAAKNYLAQAKVLGQSLKKTNPNIDFYILLADEIEDYDLDTGEFKLVEAKTLGIDSFYEMAFKYNVIEYSTSIKPYYIDYLFKNNNYHKIIYLDPDMVVYTSLDYLFDKLDEYDAIITPHITKPYTKYEGAAPEEELLFVGIYNLGFFGIKRSSVGQSIIDWWKEKLLNQCYADKEDGLHVDQKWMDFLPALYDNKVGIIRHPGVNAAFWNMHERTFVDDGQSYTLDGEDLIIYHFSGLDVEDYDKICRKQTKYTLENKPEYTRLFKSYANALISCGAKKHRQMIYTYARFSDGTYIVPFQRRLMRGLLRDGYLLNSNPFIVEGNSFYHLLNKSNLIIRDNQGKFAKLQKAYPNYKSMFDKANKLRSIFKKLIGIKRYYMIMRYLDRTIRFEDQMFLLKK
jgi:hypothetical protein